jgi:hypothetical protein
MTDIIKKSDVSVKDPVGDLNEGLSMAIKLTKELEEAQISHLKISKEIAKQNKKPTNIKELKALDEVITDIDKTTKELNETREVAAKLTKAQRDEEKKLTKIEKDRLKIEKQLQQARSKENQDNDILKVQLQEQRKENKELAKDKLGLINAYDKESKRLIKLRKQYKDLRIEEGKETKATRRLKTEIQRLDRELKEIDESAGQFQRNVGDYPQIFGNATNSIIKTAAAAVGLKLSFDGIGSAAQGSVEGSENVRKVTSALSGGLKVAANVAASAIVDLFDFGKAVAEGGADLVDITDAFDQTADAAENFGSKVAKSGEQGIEIAQSLIDLEKASRPLEVAVSALNKVIDVQSVLAGDTTRSFAEQTEAAIKAQEAQTKRANILIKLASEELRISNLQIAQAEASGGASVELLDSQTAAIVKLQEARNLAATEEIETEKLLREIKRDRFEKELDFAIDAFDAVKTGLERQIALEDQSFIQRAENLDKLKVLSDSAFQSQIDLLEAQVGQGVNIRELTKLEDERLIRARLINNASLTDEIVLQRILEVIRERKTVTLDIADAEREVTQALKEQLEESDSIFNDIDQTRKQRQIDAEDDIVKRSELRKEQLISQAEFESNLAKEGSDERILIAEKLKNDLAQVDRERIAGVIRRERELQQAREDIADARINTAKNLADILGTLAGEDEEAQKAAQRLSAILAIAEIRQNLAKEESAIRERNADKENAAALNSAQITQAKTAAAAGVISILAAQFAEGGYTGDGGKYDVAGTVHKGEFVNTKDQTSKYGMKGWTASDFDKNVKEGYFNQFAGNDLLMSPHSFKQLELGRTITPNEVSYKKMISEQKTSTATLKKAIEANRPILKVYRDGDGNQVNDENRGGRRRLTTYKKDRNRL